MNLFVRTPDQKKYHRQSYDYPALPIGVKPGDTLYTLWADYHVDKIEYRKSDITVYATKTQIFTERKD